MFLSTGRSIDAVQVLREGYILPFHSRPPLSSTPIPLPSCSPSSIKGFALVTAVKDLLSKGAIELASAGPGFYSRLFITPKVNLPKSSLTPSQRLDYLGMTLQSSLLRAFPSQARVQKVRCLVEEFSSHEQPLSLWRSLLGVMSSLSTLIPGSGCGHSSNNFWCVAQWILRQHQSLGTTPAGGIFSGGPFCPISWEGWTYPFHIRSSCSTPTTQTRVGERLSAPTISPAGGLTMFHSFSINHRELLAVCLPCHSGFSPSPQGQDGVFVHQQNTSALSYLRKEGGTRSSTLSSVAQAILRLCEDSGVHLLPQFVPGRLNVLADSISRRGQVLGSEWTLHQKVCRDLFRLWSVTVDLFATSINHRLQVYFSPMADPQVAAVVALIQPWDHLQAYAFPPFSLIQKVLTKVRGSHNLEMTLVAPFWPLRPWFPDLLDLLVEVPVLLPHRRDLLRQPHFHLFHGNLRALGLTGFRIASDPRTILDSLREWLVNCLFQSPFHTVKLLVQVVYLSHFVSFS